MKSFIYVITFLALLSLFSSKRIRGPFSLYNFIKHNFTNEELQLFDKYEACIEERHNKKESTRYDLICSKEFEDNMSKLRNLNRKFKSYLLDN